MMPSTTPLLTEIIRNAAHPLTGASDDYDSLLELVGDARFVLLGEASHGTHEFYRERAKITKRLICENGFNAVALEADWPDAYRVHRYVQGDNTDTDASEALSGFKRFPSWMWRNADVLDFVGWMRSHNDALDASRRVGIFGMDLYSMHASIERVLHYLDEVDPAAARRARGRYGCFDTFGCDPQAYGHFTGLGLEPSCEDEAVAQLIELQHKSLHYSRIDGLAGMERFFDAEQNAAVVRDAEEYYRAMFQRTIYRGTFATGTWWIRSTRWSAISIGCSLRRRWWCGRTTRMWATHARPRWGTPASGTSGNWFGSSTAMRAAPSA